MNYSRLIVFCVGMFCLNAVYEVQAQKSKDFGQVSKEELQMSVYPGDSVASAVVLFDVGKSYIEYNGWSSLKTVFERHRRIKIFTKEGYKWADVEIPYYRKGAMSDRVVHLKAKVHSLENGKIKTIKVSRKEIIDEQKSKYWGIKKISMPHIKEGVVIEYSYKIVSGFSHDLRHWKFQTSIPVLYSQYTTEVPVRLFDYVKIFQGNVQIKQVKRNESINKTFAGRNEVCSVNEWVATNVPKFEEEKYMTDRKNHIAKIEFQLQRFLTQTSFSIWKNLDESLLKDAQFGQQLKRKNVAEDIFVAASKVASRMEKAKVIYDKVRRSMKWNGDLGYAARSSLKKAYKAKQGNSADINLLLLNLLKRTGFKAYPVILSTRSHEKINTFYPILSKFNYVIVAVLMDNKSYLLDATDKLRPFSLLPHRCLSGNGRIITDENLRGYWINLYQGHKNQKNITAKLTLDEKGMLRGAVDIHNYDYSALIARKRYKNKKREMAKEVLEGEGDEKGLKILEVKQLNLENIDKPLKSSFKVEIEGKVQKAGDLLYLNPMLYWQLEDTPFKLKNRQYPVDFGAAIRKIFYLKLTLPKGYKVESLPESKALKLPFKGAVYHYSAKHYDGYVVIISRLDISRTVFSPEQYAYLKEFYAQMVSKQAEQIVLKKNN